MKVLITAPYHEKARQELETELGAVVYRPWKTHGRAYNESELTALLEETKADALITEHDQVTESVIRGHPDLHFIGVCRGTPSNVAVDVASELHIPVFYTPARNAQAVAEMFVSNVILLLRKTLPARQWLLDEKWEAGAHTSYLQFKGNELAGKTIGMVGFGAVGQRIAHLVWNFPCRIQYYDPFLAQASKEYRNVSLEEVFSGSHIVSVHLPANEHTRGMIDKTLISKMRRDAIFVNTSRAMVVKSDHLLEALEGGSIRGAVLDVFDHEPPDELDYRLIRHPSVLATPHIAGATFEVEDHHADIMNGGILGWLAQGKRDTRLVVNKDSLKVNK
ncbi:MAG TPA: NAD(P)-dependent oxidoreductase [Puia sp.]|nr:NAD(P)-dependent oxidoreductase [Puia sp.]